jgi:hypothetical protein
MKKIVRRNHLRESFRANLLQEGFTADDVADTFLPFVSAARNIGKGNYWGAAGDLALDAASIAAGAFTGGAGYVGARAAISAAKAGTKVATKFGRTVAKPFAQAAKKIARPRTVKGTSGIPNTGKGKKGPWDTAIANAKAGRTAKPKTGGKKGGAGTAAAVGAAGGALAGGLLGGSSGGMSDRDIMGKERPQTGFGNRMQGIDPFRSGEMRTSAGYYDTPVGRRQLYKGAGGGLVAPPSSMYEGKVYEQLKEMVSNSIKTKEINNILVTQDMAKNIVNLHEALNTDNKKILEKNIQSKDGFFEVLDFSVRN